MLATLKTPFSTRLQRPFALRLPNPGLSAADVYSRLCRSGPGFILETGGPASAARRRSYVGGPGCGIELAAAETNPFAELRRFLAQSGGDPGTRTGEFTGGPVGYIAYEAVKHIEPSVGHLRRDPTGCPQAGFFLADRFVALDHARRDLVIVSGGRGIDAVARRRRAEETAHAILSGATVPSGGRTPAAPGGDVRPIVARADYEDRIRRAREAIIGGELIQVVLTQRVERRTTANPLDIYRALTELNPSPYMYLLNFGGFQLIGASPELMVRVRAGVVSTHPIAGTRPRGRCTSEDSELREELVTSEKERAEHVMLLDLARNDLGRVCAPGTIRVESPLHVERYSHVQHLVTRVSGSLRAGRDAVSALEAGFPAGTLVGAPKVRAASLIGELEHEGRGPYTGAVGWFGGNGDMDTGTIIRSIVLRDGIAHVQGGGGIVFDSDPASEYEESWHKMRAPLEAIDAAEQVDALDAAAEAV